MGPLDGIRVVEISDSQAGCVAGMMLADHGASVTRIDRPGSSLSRATPGFLVWNRGKQSVSLNLELPQGRDLLGRLLVGADVLVETFGPGEAEAFGLDPESMSRQFPRLIHCSVTGYDRDGPDWDRPDADGLVQARTGVMLEGDARPGVSSGFTQRGPRPGAKYMGFPAASYSAGFYGVLAILTAITVRHQTGRGQHVNSSLSGAFWAMTRRVMGENAGGREPAERGPGGSYECGDGQWVHTHTGARGSSERFLKVWGLEEYSAAAPNPVRWTPEVTEEFRAKAQAIMKTKPRAEWVRLFDENDCPNAAVRRPGEAFDDEQANIVDMVATVQDPEFGPLQEVGVPIKFARTPGEIRGSAPAPGEHTDAVLSGIGIGSAELSRLRSEGVI